MVQIRNNKIRWAISALLALLILFGTFNSIFSIAAFLICGLMLVFVDKESTLYQMFFILPMANIFKMSPGSQSFFTILLLAYVVLHMVLPRKATLLVVLFALYVVIGELWADSFNLFRTIKLICNLLFLSSILNSEVKLKNKEIFFSYISGNIVASTISIMDSSFFNVESYIGRKEIAGNIAQDVERFAGLYEDPNYYSIGLIISLCLVVILFYRREIKPIFGFLLSIVMVYFLLQTYSKSALIMMVLPVILLLYVLIKDKKYVLSIFIVFSALLTIFLAFSGKIPALELVIERIRESETAVGGTDINALTTGRLDIWIMYIEYFINHIRSAIFGVSISADLVEGSAAHNTYIDVFYHLGVLGGTLLVSILAVISRQSRHIHLRRNFLNYSIMICIGIMYFFLSELFYFDTPFQIFIAFSVLNLPLIDEERIKIANEGVKNA